MCSADETKQIIDAALSHAIEERIDPQFQELREMIAGHDERITAVEDGSESRDAQVKQNATGIVELKAEISSLKETIDRLPTVDDIVAGMQQAIDQRNLFYVRWIASRKGVSAAGAILLGALITKLLESWGIG